MNQQTAVQKQYWVYILTNANRTLYIGVTSDLACRIYEHKNSLTPGFTSRYGVAQLVYIEKFDDIRDAIAREKQLKGWRRSKKIALIETVNPDWEELVV